ncbi:MAG: hypothetical protein ACK47B_10170 [Armatimonadota bacterium]
MLQITRKQHHQRTYRFRNKSAARKTVLVQQPKEPGFELAQPMSAAETTPDSYRFRITIPPGKTESLVVTTEHPLTETVAIIEANVDLLITHARSAQASAEVRRALEQIVERRRAFQALQERRSAVEGELRAIDTEQARIRQNMAQLDRNSELYQQYVRKLTEQEAQIEQLRAEQRRLRDEEAAAAQELRRFLDNLSVS